ncbi:YraN family protein [Paenibacillus oryzisoli]|uniref:YraN family protein n=1 Tax=Paenibacillus oryzisoli TaxID=1850517 RepID=UPI003D26C336
MTNAKNHRKTLGKQGEALAAVYLQEHGSQIVAANWRCRSGEIDLIALEQQTLLFVEVRTRRATGRFGSAAESVDFRKQAKVRETAQMYLHYKRQYECPVRFDVVTVEFFADREEPVLTHIKGAF